MWRLELYVYDRGWKFHSTRRYRSLDGALAASNWFCQNDGVYALIEG